MLHQFVMMPPTEHDKIHVPFFYDDSGLCMSNPKLVSVGLPSVYPYAVPLGIDNREECFLWGYFEAQLTPVPILGAIAHFVCKTLCHCPLKQHPMAPAPLF